MAESCSGGSRALHRHAAQLRHGDVVARHQLLYGGGREMPMPKTGAPSRNPKKIVPGLAPSFTASFDAEQHAGPVCLLPHRSESR